MWFSVTVIIVINHRKMVNKVLNMQRKKIIRARVCTVKDCFKTYGAYETVLFRFPKDERAKKWAIAGGLLPLYQSKRAVGLSLYDSVYRICSRHFEDNCFLGPSKRRLTSTAIPTLNLRNRDVDPTPVVKVELIEVKVELTEVEPEFVEVKVELPDF